MTPPATHELTTARIYRWEWNERWNRHEWVEIAQLDEQIPNPSVVLSAYFDSLPADEPSSSYKVTLANGASGGPVRHPLPPDQRRRRGLQPR